MATPKVRQAESNDRDRIAQMMAQLWPDSSPEELAQEIDAVLIGPPSGILPSTLLVSIDRDGTVTGFVQVGLRSHADGCDTAHPVGFLEGWFVAESFRRRGIGRALVKSAEDWARAHGCIEIASDTWIDHSASQLAHQALGFEVVDRCVHFRKPILPVTFGR